MCNIMQIQIAGKVCNKLLSSVLSLLCPLSDSSRFLGTAHDYNFITLLGPTSLLRVRCPTLL
jgi:hypothetical protein